MYVQVRERPGRRATAEPPEPASKSTGPATPQANILFCRLPQQVTEGLLRTSDLAYAAWLGLLGADITIGARAWASSPAECADRPVQRTRS